MTPDLTSIRLVFHNAPVNPEKLGQLTDDELLVLADRMGLNLPSGLDRVFVLEEIIEAFDEETEERRFSHDTPGHVEEKKFAGTGFPEISPCSSQGQAPQNESGLRYGDTMIHALARDPGWVFAYWDIAERIRSGEGEEGQPALCLRVCELSVGHDLRKDYFDIPVSHSDFQWYINMPHPGSRYRIDLCLQSGGKTKVLARSNEVALPRQYVDTEVWCDDSDTHTLILLSGSRELNIAPPDRGNPCRILFDGE